jgi:hypothetical protein
LPLSHDDLLLVDVQVHRMTVSYLTPGRQSLGESTGRAGGLPVVSYDISVLRNIHVANYKLVLAQRAPTSP